jgi:ubiquinone biosynthesis protein COQ9
MYFQSGAEIASGSWINDGLKAKPAGSSPKIRGANTLVSLNQVLKSALDLISEKGWKSFDVEYLSPLLSVPIQDIYEILPHKTDLLPLFHQHAEAALYSSLQQEDLLATSPKERIFELFLLKFEILEPYKPGLQRLCQEIWCDPKTIVSEGKAHHDSMETLVKFAGISTEGPLGFLKTKILLGIYLATFRIWLQDPSPHMEKTMAFLDQNLSWWDLQMQRYA